ncbi:unnamed protein product [Calypogeia fissa]
MSESSNSDDENGGSQDQNQAEELAPKFQREMHLQYFSWMLQELPGAYSSEESSRMTLAYFVISALDILGCVDQVAVEDTIAWVYGLQVLPLSADDSSNSADISFGFRGSPSIGIPFSPDGAQPLLYDGGHLAMTYSALAILTILGDDFSRVSREAISKSIRALQQPDGSFSPINMDRQTDLRFIFCAAAICTMLDDWTGMDRQKAVDYIIRSQSYEGGFGLSPGLECHGGATYCGLTALWLITQFDPDWSSSLPLASLINLQSALDWCLKRQTKNGGFQGRPNKPADTCYAFWIGGALRIFGMDHLCDQKALRTFLLSSQSKWGGFSKFPKEGYPDLLHSYYGVCGFSLLGEEGLDSLFFGLGLTCRSASRLPAVKRRLADTRLQTDLLRTCPSAQLELDFSFSKLRV